MTVTVNDTTTKTNMLTQMCGSQLNSGNLSWTTGADVAICQSAHDTTAFTIASGTATMNTAGSAISSGNPLTSTNNAGATATVAKAKFRKSDNTVIFTAAVSTSGSDINLTSVAIANGEAIILTGLTASIN